MFTFLKSLFKKSITTNNFFSLFSQYTKPSLLNNEYFSYFTSWQYTAVTTIADSLSSLNYRLADNHDNDFHHEYLTYITPELLQNITIFMKITWTAYILKVIHNNTLLWLSILLPQYLLSNIQIVGVIWYQLFSYYLFAFIFFISLYKLIEEVSVGICIFKIFSHWIRIITPLIIFSIYF